MTKQCRKSSRRPVPWSSNPTVEQRQYLQKAGHLAKLMTLKVKQVLVLETAAHLKDEAHGMEDSTYLHLEVVVYQAFQHLT